MKVSMGLLPEVFLYSVPLTYSMCWHWQVALVIRSQIIFVPEVREFSIAHE